MDMIPKKLKIGFCCPGRLAQPDRRLALRNWVWLCLGVILLISAVFPGASQAGSEMTLAKKGQSTMQSVAPTLTQNLPPIDATQPARAETFTFGLG